MYYKIRRGMFETNSSSTHSVTLRNHIDAPTKNTIEVSDDDYVHVQFADFGWGYDRFTDPYVKLQYLLTILWQVNEDKQIESIKPFEFGTDYIYLFYELDEFEEINEIIKRRYNCSGIKIDSHIGMRDENYPDYITMYNDNDWDNIYGIDHQSVEYINSIKDFLDEKDLSIEDFIFNSDKVLVIDNDNSPHDELGRTFNSYYNGNYSVTIYSDGTKIRKSNDGTFVPKFAESIDMTITEECNGNCPYCYAGCTPEGKHADFYKYADLLNSIHYNTEIAINGNDLTHPDLKYIHRYLNGVIVNITVNEKHFIEDMRKNHNPLPVEDGYSIITYLNDCNRIEGLGISLSSNEVSDEFIKYAKRFPNAVIHVIAGIVSLDAMQKLIDNNLKILILGYKSIGRGEQYYKDHKDEIYTKIVNLREFIKTRDFNLISFDNLALEQLSIKDLLSEEEWNKVYMGDDGEFTFYINLVEGYYAKSSLSTEKYPIDSDDVAVLFQNLKNKKN